MDISYWREVMTLTATVLSVGALIYAWFTARSKGNSAAIDGIKKDISQLKQVDAHHDQRLERMDEALKHLTSGNGQIIAEISKVHERTNSIADAVSQVSGQMSAQTRVLDTIVKHLISKGSD